MRLPMLFLTLALGMWPVAHSAEWTQIVAGKERHVEIDRNSILESDPGTKVAWGRIVMKDDEVASAGYKSVKALNRYDCRGGSFSTIKRVYLDPEQNVIREERVVEPTIVRVAPGTVDERLLREVCNPPSAADLGKIAAQAEQAAKAAQPAAAEQPSIVPRLVRPLSEAEKRAAAEAREAALRALAKAPDGAQEAKGSARRAKATPADMAAPSAAPAAAVREIHAEPKAAVRLARVEPRPKPVPRAKAEPPSAPAVDFSRVEWGYEGLGAPANWPMLKPEYSICGEGRRQSPIDVRDGIRVDLEPIQFDYRPTYFRIEDNGHTVQVSVGEGSSIRVMGRRYDLKQFHFHRPSEFRINGQGYAMEAHLVHQDLDGRLAVVSVMLDRGTAHPLVQTLWNNMPLERHDSYVPEEPIDPADLLPEDRRYATFMGSLTMPPCTEGVLWMVLKQPAQVSVEQIGIFARLYPMNARPLQQIADRLIKDSR